MPFLGIPIPGLQTLAGRVGETVHFQGIQDTVFVIIGIRLQGDYPSFRRYPINHTALGGILRRDRVGGSYVDLKDKNYYEQRKNTKQSFRKTYHDGYPFIFNINWLNFRIFE